MGPPNERPRDSQVRRARTVDEIEDVPVVKSAERTVRIFEYFDDVQREARMSDIAAHLGIPQSSTSVLLKSLVQLGYLEYDRDCRTFLPTARVALLGAWLNEGSLRNGRLLRLMEELSGLTQDTIILARRNGIYSQYLHVLQAKTPIRYHVPPAARRLLVWSATGFALLSHSSDEEVRLLVSRTNAEMLKERRRVDGRAAVNAVRQVRRSGYSLSRELVSEGAGALAMPLPDDVDRRHRLMAIGVAGVLDRMEGREKELAEILRDTVRRHLL